MSKTMCHNCSADASANAETIYGHTYCHLCVFDLFRRCDQCGDLFSNDSINCCDSSVLCNTCAGDLGFTKCDKCGDWKRSMAITDSNHWCVPCARELGYNPCVNCGVLNDSKHHVRVNGDYYCLSCADELTTVCSICGQTILKIDARDLGGRLSCIFCEMPDFKRKDEITSESFEELTSKRYFGIELETNTCDKYMLLERDDFWGAKFDPTCSAKEFDSAKMNGDEGLAAIHRLCTFAKENSWDVDERCGYHLHIDISKETATRLRAIAYAYTLTEGVWQLMVSDDREESGWCDFKSMSLNHIKNMKTKSDWRSKASYSNRYLWLNWCAYTKFGSLEIRAHEGTLDTETIENWVQAHLIFVDWAAEVGCTQVKRVFGGTLSKQFDCLCEIWIDAGHPELIDFYFEKCNYQSFDDSKFAPVHA